MCWDEKDSYRNSLRNEKVEKAKDVADDMGANSENGME